MAIAIAGHIVRSGALDLAGLSPPLKKGDLGGFQVLIKIPPDPSSVRQIFCIPGSSRKIENVAAGFSLRRPKLSANAPESSRVEEKSLDTISYFMSEHLLAGNARPRKIFM